MASRWKPSSAHVKDKGPVVDDWEADQEEDHVMPDASAIASSADDALDAWPTPGGQAAMASHKTNTKGAGPSTTSRQPHAAYSPSPTPMILSSSARTLPTSILPPSTSGAGSAPKILRREPRPESATRGPALSAQQQRKTLAERGKEYEEARRRIFGEETPSTSASSSENGSPAAVNASAAASRNASPSSRSSSTTKRRSNKQHPSQQQTTAQQQKSRSKGSVANATQDGAPRPEARGKAAAAGSTLGSTRTDAVG